MIEAQVHQQLRAYLRDQASRSSWPHHLTMARLVARALRIGRSALIQTSTQGRYPLSYLLPILMWSGPVLLLAKPKTLHHLLHTEIPQLQDWLQTQKPIFHSDRWPDPQFQGLVLSTPEVWLEDRLSQTGAFPPNIPTILDGADDLETWTRQALTAEIRPQDWRDLQLAFPRQAQRILDVQIQLTYALFQHPPNPYQCHLLAAPEILALRQLIDDLEGIPQNPQSWFLSLEAFQPHLYLFPPVWTEFLQIWQSSSAVAWAYPSPEQGCFTLQAAPMNLDQRLAPIWLQQPVILIGSALDTDANASLYQQRIGIEDLTCVKFQPDRQNEVLNLYCPDDLPLPNTPRFQALLQRELLHILSLSQFQTQLKVVIIGDTPLKQQMGAALAAAFGSRVRVENLDLQPDSILVTGWEFWQHRQDQLPPPTLTAIATLPIPSLENPLVASRVAYYKQCRQDWFRLYLLPTAIGELHRAIAPTREHQGLVALFDSRVIHRSYGQQILTALSPLARMNYLEIDDNPLLQLQIGQT